MKGVILAGGLGTRLSPLTEVTNKHLLPVGREPMIWHAVRQLVSAAIGEIMVVTSTDHMGAIVNSLGSGKRFGCEFTYRVQEEAGRFSRTPGRREARGLNCLATIAGVKGGDARRAAPARLAAATGVRGAR